MWGLAEGNGFLGVGGVGGVCLWRFTLVPFLFICFLPIMRQTDSASKSPASLMFHTTKDLDSALPETKNWLTSQDTQAGTNISHPKLFLQVVGHSEATDWLTSSNFRTAQGAQISLALLESRHPPSGEILDLWEGEEVTGELRTYREQTSSQTSAFSVFSCWPPGSSWAAISLAFWKFYGGNQILSMPELTCLLLFSI